MPDISSPPFSRTRNSQIGKKSPIRQSCQDFSPPPGTFFVYIYRSHSSSCSILVPVVLTGAATGLWLGALSLRSVFTYLASKSEGCLAAWTCHGEAMPDRFGGGVCLFFFFPSSSLQFNIESKQPHVTGWTSWIRGAAWHSSSRLNEQRIFFPPFQSSQNKYHVAFVEISLI